MLKSYENNTLIFECTICGQDIAHTFAPNYEPTFQSDYNSYENLKISCPLCEVQGRSTTHILNLNIPEHEEMEAIMNLDENERKNRELLRKIMWDKRSDLKNLDREQERQKFITNGN